jgi:hypothetical protein
MAKVRVELKEIKKLLNDSNLKVNTKVAAATGDLIVKLMLEKIAKGLSPIEGKPRFPGYKDPKKYPGSKQVKEDFPDKRNRPVNLTLSGKFLSGLKSKVSPVRGQITIGFFDAYGKTLEQGHREGANGQRERPIIPEPSEDLAKSIRLAILRLYEAAIRNYLRGR